MKLTAWQKLIFEKTQDSGDGGNCWCESSCTLDSDPEAELESEADWLSLSFSCSLSTSFNGSNCPFDIFKDRTPGCCGVSLRFNDSGMKEDYGLSSWWRWILLEAPDRRMVLP